MSTQGPWEVEIHGREGSDIDQFHCAVVATVYDKVFVVADTLNCGCVFKPNEQRANARLIAAAPDLLDVAQNALACLRHTHDRISDNPEFETLRITINAEVRSIKAAIAKAETAS